MAALLAARWLLSWRLTPTMLRPDGSGRAAAPLRFVGVLTPKDAWLFAGLSEVLIILGLILANGFFAGAEIAIIAARRGRLEQLAKGGDRASRVALELAKDPGRFLPTVQVGITLVGTFAAAFGGASLSEDIALAIAATGHPWFAPYAETIALTIVVICITTASVILGELVPKRLALQHAAVLARVVALPMHYLSTAARPIVGFMGLSTDAILWMLGAKGEHEPAVSLEDIEGLIHGAGGVLEEAERNVALGALRLGERTAREIMQPRLDLDALEVNTPADEILGVVAMAGYSRLPVYEQDLDHIVGVINIKDVLRCHYLNLPMDLKRLAHPALMVPETLPIDRLLVALKDNGSHIAVVLDEFGGTRGIVTLQDVVEELVGEIRDEHERDDDQQIVERDANSWLVDGVTSFAHFIEKLDVQPAAGTGARRFSTVAGLILAELGQIPRVGQTLDWEGLHFEVVDMDGPRIDRLLVTKAPPPTDGEKSSVSEDK